MLLNTELDKNHPLEVEGSAKLKSQPWREAKSRPVEHSASHQVERSATIMLKVMEWKVKV